ncbi:HlyD family type I secretion periplasmic adaptor subunit [Halomonas caseinilytica]|uniref:HlyD family type I secretion periplasmic adaptor subunit n=1 Tax=Halomonas caseinilytica TaxID=438744 RepID=UPI000848A017|nr:HlyD family type I secretion periplasmic adaptor subunit [Halomonas caseinilytica]
MHSYNSKEARKLPTSSRTETFSGMIIVLLAFGGFGLWAILAKLPVSVIGSGTVAAESYKKTVQHLDGGIVSEIKVSDGDQVASGDPLILLDNSQVTSELETSEAQVFTAWAELERLSAEDRGDEDLYFSKELLEKAKDKKDRHNILSIQKDLFYSRRRALKGEVAALEEQIRQFNIQVDGLRESLIINRDYIESLDKEAADYRSLFKKGLGNNQRIRELERKILQYRSQNLESNSQILQMESRINENKLKIKAKQQSHQRDISSQLREVQDKLSTYRGEEKILRLKLERSEIKAPVSGTVVGLSVHTIGAVIKPANPIVHIIPLNDEFIVEARIPAQDINNVHPGQYARIRFSAFNQRRIPIMSGIVQHVSADSFKDETSNMHYYRALVSVTSEDRDKLRLISGMPAEIMIRTGEKTLLEYLLEPLTDMLQRALRQD